MPSPTEERSLADTPADPAAAATSPLGAPNPATGAPAPQPTIEPPVVSIVDTIFQLDSFLSGDVRRAEKTARFCSKPWIEAEIDELRFQLEGLLDDTANPLPGMDDQVTATAMAVQAKQAEYGAAFVSVRMGQLSSDDWKAWRTKWREVLDKTGEKPAEFWDDLIAVSAIRPPITVDQAGALRTRLGDPQMDELAGAAWEVNTSSGVSIPKSPLSSHVLRRAVRAQS